MPDRQTHPIRGDQAEPLKSHYDLIVVGAGIAGLNALHAASLHLPRSSKILLIDAKDRPGGMWTMTYDYLHLHQPHPLFTVGGMKWKWHKPAHYLAARGEVQHHLASCLETLRGQFDVEERFGHSVSAVREVQQSGAWRAEVDVHKIDDPDVIVTVGADRVIHAAGFDYIAPEPIKLSSKSVQSITPADLSTTLAQNQNAPIYIIGGGKTGMDTILAVLDENPKRAVTLINGAGTYYYNRTQNFPTGLKRWIGGNLAANIFRDCALRFDGHNDADTCAHFIATYAVNSDLRSQNFIYGILSEDESRRIETGLQDKIWDYLEDIVESQSGPVMHMRSGAQMPIADGSIIVNCTGSLLRPRPSEGSTPCLSPNDTILSINLQDAMHILTTYSSFVLSHLFFTGRLRKAGLYLLDLETLFRLDKHAFSAATMAQSYHNLLMGYKNLPTEARKNFGMDFNLWYPLPRRLLALNRIRKSARADIQHCRKSLDVVVKRFDIRGGMMT